MRGCSTEKTRIAARTTTMAGRKICAGRIVAQYAPSAEAQNATNATGSRIFHGILSERI